MKRPFQVSFFFILLGSIALPLFSQDEIPNLESNQLTPQRIGPSQVNDSTLQERTVEERRNDGIGSRSTPTLPSSTPLQNNLNPSVLPSTPPKSDQNPSNKTILINFSNVNAVELIRFISKISGKNFVFDENDLQFTITIVSEEPTTIENIMAALLQELRIHGLTLLEQGNNIVIHQSANVSGITKVVADNLPEGPPTEIVTKLFRLNTADADKIAILVRPLVSQNALVEVFKDTNHLIVTDISANVKQISDLVKSLDAPNNGLVIGQYAVKSGFIDSLILLGQKIMQPISQDQTLIFVPHRSANSIFIISTPFLVERSIGMLQYLDQNQGLTRIFDLNDLKFGANQANLQQGKWELDPQGNWIFRPLQQPGVPNSNQPPAGYWYIDDQGNWRFQLGAPPPNPSGIKGFGTTPEGRWVLDSQGVWVFQLNPGKSVSPEALARPNRAIADLPAGHIERTQFFIYKLHYRKGDQVQSALGKIGLSLQQAGSNNGDLIEAIDSVQWIEASNSLIFTGTQEALDKVRELVREVDRPLRQVFIEMLILETDIDDSLNFGVNWGTKFGGGNTAGAQAFLSGDFNLPTALGTSGSGLVPSAVALANAPGYTLGIIGQHLTHGGIEFSTIGALVRALHDQTNAEIVMNPKILVEDNTTAEIFVGINTSFPSQAVVNDQGVILTQNFEFRDVGTLLRVTPLIGDNDIVTLLIEEEVSAVISNNVAVGSIGPVPTTRTNRTRTTVHLPNEFFLILSGMIQNEHNLRKHQIPCLGSVPFIGAAFSDRRSEDHKRNLMIFIRPRIIDTEDQIDNLTKHQQDVWNYKKSKKKSWKYEVDEALDFFNLPNPDGPEECDEECLYQSGGCCCD